MALSKFFKDALFVQLLNVLIKPIWILVVDRAVQNLLPPEQYVAYYSWLSFTILFVILLDVGINTYNNTRVASDHNLLKVQFGSFTRAKSILAILYGILVAGVAMIIGIPSAEVIILTLLVVYQILVSYGLFFRSNITALGFFRTEGWLSVSDRAFSIVICAMFLWTPALRAHFNITIFIIIQLIGAFITLILSGNILRPFLKNDALSSKKVKLSKVIQETWPYALLVALMGIYSRTDAVMLRYLAADGTSETEAYAMGYRLLDAGSMLLAVFSGMLLPAFVKILKQPSALRDLSHKAFGYIYLLVFPAVLICVFYPAAIIDFLYPDKLNYASYDVFSGLMAVLPAAALIYVFGTLLTATGDLRYLNSLAFITVIINVLGNILLIPVYGSGGAAIATLLSQGLFALGCLVRCYRKFNWQWHFRNYRRYVLWTILMLALFLPLTLANFSWEISALAAYGAALLLAWMLGFLKKISLHMVD